MPINEQAADVAFNTFLHQTPDAEERFTGAAKEPNLTVLIQYIVREWGQGSRAEESSSSWDIAYRALKPTLALNPDYISAENRRRLDSMSTAQVREAMRSEPGFASLWDRYSKATVPLESISSDPWVGLTVETYNSLEENERRRLYASDFSFRQNVARLVAEGAF